MAMTDYVHGYGTPEQERLVEQAEHWRHRLIRDDTELEPGTRLLEVGCGVGAVLAVLGQEYPGVELFGVDIEQKQLDFARGYLERAGVEATLRPAVLVAGPGPVGSGELCRRRHGERPPRPRTTAGRRPGRAPSGPDRSARPREPTRRRPRVGRAQVNRCEVTISPWRT